MKTVYLGDGVFLGTQEDHRLWMYTSDGMNRSNQICLETEVIISLFKTLIKEYPDLKHVLEQ